MAASQSGVGIGSMFNKREKPKKIETPQDYEKELKALKLEEQRFVAELQQLEQDLPEKRKAFNELLKKRAIIDEALKKVETQLMIERIKEQSKERK